MSVHLCVCVCACVCVCVRERLQLCHACVHPRHTHAIVEQPTRVPPPHTCHCFARCTPRLRPLHTHAIVVHPTPAPPPHTCHRCAPRVWMSVYDPTAPCVPISETNYPLIES